MDIAIKPATMSQPQISIKKKLNHPIDKVWRALTDKEALSEWLMETGGFELSPGYTFQFKTTPRGKFDGIVDCKIKSVDAPYHLQYSWRAKGMAQATIVTWSLRSIEDHATILTLTHDGFVGIDGWLTKTMLHFGWKRLLSKKLNNYLTL